MMNSKLNYQVGAFLDADGAGSANDSDSLLCTGRLTINFWEAESGFYHLSAQPEY